MQNVGLQNTLLKFWGQLVEVLEACFAINFFLICWNLAKFKKIVQYRTFLLKSYVLLSDNHYFWSLGLLK